MKLSFLDLFARSCWLRQNAHVMRALPVLPISRISLVSSARKSSEGGRNFPDSSRKIQPRAFSSPSDRQSARERPFLWLKTGSPRKFRHASQLTGRKLCPGGLAESQER
jgi:hypothetical protein